jgi:pyruvate-ferredoxin/flavodoxin oxidoreductase
MLVQSNPAAAKALLEEAKADVTERWRMYEHMAALPLPNTKGAHA